MRHEEERLVLSLVDLGNPDGSSQGAAPLVELVVISRAADRVIGKRIGVKGGSLQEFVRCAVQGVRAALQRYSHHSAAVAPILRVIGSGHDFELLYGIH